MTTISFGGVLHGVLYPEVDDNGILKKIFRFWWRHSSPKRVPVRSLFLMPNELWLVPRRLLMSYDPPLIHDDLVHSFGWSLRE